MAALKTLDQIATMAWVDQHGGDSTTLKFVELPNAAVGDALAAGRIDCATVVNPALAEALDSGKARTLGRSFDAIGRRFLIAVWFTTAAALARNGEAVRKFAEGVREAAAFTNVHHAETVPLLAAFSRIEPEVIERMPRSTTALELDARDLRPTIDASAAYKVIDRRFPAAELLAGT